MPMARLSGLGHSRLQSLAARRGTSHQQVLDEALELLERKQFFEEAHREYQNLRSDPEANAQLDRELGVLDGVLSDEVEP